MWHIPNLAQQHNENQLCKACVKLQHDELLKMVTSINDKGSKTLKELIAEGENRLEESNLLKESWKQDVLERLSLKDQQNSG